MDASGESLLEFPCDFPVKIMGAANAEFETLVIDIIKRHAADFKEESVRTRASRNGRYVSLTATIHARDQAQLDGLYRDLSAHEQVLFAL